MNGQTGPGELSSNRPQGAQQGTGDRLPVRLDLARNPGFVAAFVLLVAADAAAFVWYRYDHTRTEVNNAIQSNIAAARDIAGDAQLYLQHVVDDDYEEQWVGVDRSKDSLHDLASTFIALEDLDSAHWQQWDKIQRATFEGVFLAQDLVVPLHGGQGLDQTQQAQLEDLIAFSTAIKNALRAELDAPGSGAFTTMRSTLLDLANGYKPHCSQCDGGATLQQP